VKDGEVSEVPEQLGQMTGKMVLVSIKIVLALISALYFDDQKGCLLFAAILAEKHDVRTNSLAFAKSDHMLEVDVNVS